MGVVAMSNEIVTKSDKNSTEYQALIDFHLAKLANFTLYVMFEHDDIVAFVLPFGNDNLSVQTKIGDGAS